MDYKNLFLKLFYEVKSPFRFASNFIRYLGSRYSDPNHFVLSKDKLNSISIHYLQVYCSLTNKIDNDIWSLFWNCQVTNFVQLGNGSFRKELVLPRRKT